MRAVRLTLLVITLAVALPAAIVSAQDVTPGYDPIYRLDSGDAVQVTVFNHEDLSGQYTVNGQGTISIPLAGEVEAAGLTLRELEAAVEDALKPDYLKNPKVSTEMLNYRPFYILGEVNSPGRYEYVDGMKVINAVALAGGYTYRAKQSRVYIERGGDEGRRLKAGPESTVLPGDIIHVPERFF